MPTRVVVRPLAQFRALFVGIIRKLVTVHGAKVVVIAARSDDLAFWRSRLDGLSGVEIVVASLRYANLFRVDLVEAEVVAKAHEYEKELGTTINMLAVADRHLGRGYSPGGFFHPRSRYSENSTYLQMVAAFVDEITWWRDLLDGFQPDLVIGGNEITSRLCRVRNIANRYVFASRYMGYYYWANTDKGETDRVEPTFARAEAQVEEVILSKSYKANELYLDSYKNSLVHAVVESAKMALRYVWWNIKSYEKAKGYYLISNIKYILKNWSDYRQMTRGKVVRLSQLDGKDFAFFPLHTEPETALQALSPEYFFQLETIIRISRDLPAGYILAVKDTEPALGRRPIGFYDQIRELKNVAILDVREKGIDVIRKARLVATISGTAGFEAAVMGKPVVSFGAHNLYNFLPHVFRVGRDGELSEGLARALSPEFDSAEANSNGSRYLAAIKEISFDMDDFNPFAPDTISETSVGNAFDALLESVAAPSAA